MKNIASTYQYHTAEKSIWVYYIRQMFLFYKGDEDICVIWYHCPIYCSSVELNFRFKSKVVLVQSRHVFLIFLFAWVLCSFHFGFLVNQNIPVFHLIFDQYWCVVKNHLFFLNWDLLHVRQSSHCKTWRNKKGIKKKIKMKSI